MKVTLGRGRQFRNCYYIYEGYYRRLLGTIGDYWGLLGTIGDYSRGLKVLSSRWIFGVEGSKGGQRGSYSHRYTR